MTLTIECKLELPKHIGKKLSMYIVVIIMVVMQFRLSPCVNDGKLGQSLGTTL